MEQRRHRRIRLLLKAQLLIDGKAHSGFIEDISEEGMKYSLSSFLNTTGEFRPKKTLKISFQIPSGEHIELDCELIWFVRKTPSDTELSLGMRINNPTKTFREFVERLS